MTELILYVVGFIALCLVVARIITNGNKHRQNEKEIYEREASLKRLDK